MENSTAVRYKVLEYAHFPLWIIKDAFWFGALHFEAHKPVLELISLTFAIPTILISFYLIVVSKSSFQRLEHLLIGFWLMANTLWMTSDFFGWAVTYWSIGFFSAGLLITPLFFYRLIQTMKKL